jgi:hypothetical protein
MADETPNGGLPADLQTGPICSVDMAGKSIRLGYVEDRVETGAVVFPDLAAGEIAFVALKAAQALPASEGAPRPTRLLAPNSAAVAPSSTAGVIGLMFRFGDATFGVELNADAAQQIGQGLITASVRAQRV